MGLLVVGENGLAHLPLFMPGLILRETVDPYLKSTPPKVEAVPSLTRAMSTRPTLFLRFSVNQVNNTIPRLFIIAWVLLLHPLFTIIPTCPSFLRTLVRWLTGWRSDSRPIVLFDGECNLCNKFVQTLLKYDSCDDDIRGNLRFAALQSHVGNLLLRRMADDLRAQVVSPSWHADDLEAGERYNTIVVCGPSKTYIQSSAVFQILQSLGGSSKRLKAIQYLALLGYVLPTRVRDGLYQIISKRRKKWFGSSNECLLWDERFETRFVDDGVLTGTYRDPFANPHDKRVVPASVNLFEGACPPVRGDSVRIIWPEDSKSDPSVSYDDEFPDGICITGGTATISTIDLPMRIVLRVDRNSLGLGPDEKGGETMIAWVKPHEVALLQ